MPTRRQFVRLGTLSVASLAVGCVRDAHSPASIADATPEADATADAIAEADVVPPTPACLDTDDNILGPYYRDGAPLRSDLVDPPTLPGTRFALSGRVLGPDCKTPLVGATVDVWQADAAGAYDDGIFPPPADLFRLRGRVIVDASGRYSFKTLIPGHYLNGAQYRPAHVHVKITAAGHRELVTQLYFEGDPYNEIDPYIKPRLVMKPVDDGTGKKATYDFVLASA
ncbi:MAG: hypothetical protein IPJ34_35955 [Myxococcales bacterium]|nr:hypothetical protein [Myxococcales bacterium]